MCQVRMRNHTHQICYHSWKNANLDTMLNQKQRTGHRKLRSAQMNESKRFKLNSMVLAKIQIQNNKKEGNNTEIGIQETRYPYRVIKIHPGRVMTWNE